MSKLKLNIVTCLLLITCHLINAQHFLSTNGSSIVNENQEPILLRGMGLGGWMVQEGYMLQTAEFANPQHKIRATIEELIGVEDTEAFYEAWLINHVQKADIDSLKAWGFNSVRLPLHYNLFTLPIEEEPIAGQHTWLSKGFELTDQLISWCKQNEMYVILDMHAAPGGQGYDEAISDYDPTKPSLWESNQNKLKLVALWGRIAERYADEQWVAGYDLLNEPNWDLPGGAALKSLYLSLTQSIRAVDSRHILFIEGNWFANDFTGLTPPWDDQLVYSPHKYWSTNDVATMQWVLDMRNTYNVPLYLGESGENSNVWFRDAISLLEGLDIGWAWWPMKKVESIAGPLSIEKTDEYESLLQYWKGNAPRPTQQFARDALFDLAEKLKIENCYYQKDVIDAMFRQVYSDATLPFKEHTIPGVIHATDYDLGNIGQAYYDEDAANYQVSTGEFTAWNAGWRYRNDGVDIESSVNLVNSNGFNVGFTAPREWMQYEVSVDESAVYDIHVRAASGASGGRFHFSMDGAAITSKISPGSSGGWQTWQTVVIPDVVLGTDEKYLRFHVDAAGANIASFEFKKSATSSQDLETIFVAAQTSDETTIEISTNKPIDSETITSAQGFQATIDGVDVTVTSVVPHPDNSRILRLSIDQIMKSTDLIKVTYSGTYVQATDATLLQQFTLQLVDNTLDFVHQLPGRIEAEDYIFQSGVVLEPTTDLGGGQNVGFLDVDDVMQYEVNIATGGIYNLTYRTAAEFGTGGVALRLIDEQGTISMIADNSFTSTGGWQSWTSTSSSVTLPQGRYTMEAVITQAPLNLNWFEFELLTSVVDEQSVGHSINLFPSLAKDWLTLQGTISHKQDVVLTIYDCTGAVLSREQLLNVVILKEEMSVEQLKPGIYFLSIQLEGGHVVTKRFVKI